MLKNKKAVWLRSITSFCLMLALLVTSSMVALAGAEAKPMAGVIIVAGQNTVSNDSFVTLNGERAFSGRTFFSSGVISTSEKAAATIKLGKLGSINLTPNSVLSLSFSENNISGELSAGNAEVFNNEGVTVNIKNTITNAAVIPSQQTQTTDDDDDDDDNSPLGPLLVFAGIVAVAVVVVLRNKDDDDDVRIVSPRR
ncbi:MAG: hypothetical protein H0U96_00915 [Acidobacteria bacterium]|nr:hypothetical protein [Acidobacteriota bacterium]